MTFCSFLGEGSPTKIDYRKNGTLILTSLRDDLDFHFVWETMLVKPAAGHSRDELRVLGNLSFGIAVHLVS